MCHALYTSIGNSNNIVYYILSFSSTSELCCQRQIDVLHRSTRQTLPMVGRSVGRSVRRKDVPSHDPNEAAHASASAYFLSNCFVRPRSAVTQPFGGKDRNHPEVLHGIILFGQMWSVGRLPWLDHSVDAARICLFGAIVLAACHGSVLSYPFGWKRQETL